MPLLDEMARQRATIYRWFSQLLFQELTDEGLLNLRHKQSLMLLNALKLIPELSLLVSQFQRRLRAALKREERQLELAADFASLFLLPSPAGVSPYGGHYPHTSSSQERQTLRQWLVDYRLVPQNNEAADHVAVQLALTAKLIEEGVDLGQQMDFLQRHLLSWLPLLAKRCCQRDSFGFYAAMISVIAGFVEQDVFWLDACLPVTA
ncbi:MAG: molecular chaperone TorD [Enterobacterales bacterium]|uniref:molecular chaperone TorD n=1 Tax=Serratia sp. (in: enterobacteria) TaxID=616 RepID=UPI003F3B68E1